MKRPKRVLRAARSPWRTQCQNPRWTSHVTLAALRAQRVGVMRRSWQARRSSCRGSPWLGHLEVKMAFEARPPEAEPWLQRLQGWVWPPIMA